MSFKYQPLKPDEIRLLKFVSYAPGSTPVFRIVHASVNSKPKYAALSYRWSPRGQSTAVFAITVDMQRFEIGQNLHLALHQIFRSKFVDEHIWIDAICINQRSNEERSSQVRRMRQIYEDAARVLVWLGNPPDDERNKLAYAMIEDLYQRFSKFDKALVRKGYRPWWWPKKGNSFGDRLATILHELSPASDKSIFDVPGSPTHQAWVGIVSLWQNEWWSRTWVFQEATIPERTTQLYLLPLNITIMPPGKVSFLFGDQQTDWNRLKVVNSIANYLINTPRIDSSVFNGRSEFLTKMVSIRTTRELNLTPAPLDLLQSFRMTDCSDPRDKVYAPLCLAPDDIRQKIPPDYGDKTASEVYADVVRYHLASNASNLDFLGYAKFGEGSNIVESSDGVASILPSWIPNFSHKLAIWPIPKILHVPVDMERRRFVVIDRRQLPSDKGEKQPSYRPLAVSSPAPYINGPALCITGVFIDYIKDLIPNSIPGKDREAVLSLAREKGRKWHSDANQRYFTGETFNQAYNRALVLDLVFDYQKRAAGRGGQYDHELQKKSPANLSAVEAKYQDEMKQAHWKAVISRQIALSQRHYILIVPDSAVVGDLIWAFVKGGALYILRPIDRARNQYVFIGECYAHGLMDGEIDRRLQFREAKLEQIQLF